MKYAMVVVALIVMAGCSNKGIYGGLQNSSRSECYKAPPEQYDECLKRSGQTYDDYELDRKEVLAY